MMDKKSLLENGLLEQYLLGELNAIECKQIEQLLASDTELKAHFDQLEKDFETIGLENAITPPTFIKTQLIDKINSSSNETKVVDLKANNNSKFYLGIVASIAALLLVGSFWMYNQLNDVKQQLQTVENEKTELNSTIKNLNKRLENKTTLYAVIAHPETDNIY